MEGRCAMKVLVAVGSKYGSTRGIAHVITDELKSLGFQVDLEDACDVPSVKAYDAVVIGSAIYGGWWRRDAAELVRLHVADLRNRDVWLFSAGIIELKAPGSFTDEAKELAALVEAEELKSFVGAIDYDRLNAGEREVIRVINPPVGDHRDLSAAREWAHGIGVRLLYLALA